MLPKIRLLNLLAVLMLAFVPAYSTTITTYGSLTNWQSCYKQLSNHRFRGPDAGSHEHPVSVRSNPQRHRRTVHWNFRLDCDPSDRHQPFYVVQLRHQ